MKTPLSSAIDLAHAMGAQDVILSAHDQHRSGVVAVTKSVSCWATVPGDYAGPATVLPVRQLRAQLRAASSDVTIRQVSGLVQVRDDLGATTYRPTGAATDIVQPVWVSGGAVVDRAALLSALRLVVVAADEPNNYRPALTSVCIEIGQGEIAMTATNGSRLHHLRIPADHDDTAVGTGLLPADVARLWVRLLAASRADGAVLTLGSILQLTCDQATIQCAPVPATFPLWREIKMPCAVEVTTDRRTLTQAVRSLIPVAVSHHHTMRLDLDRLCVSAGPDGGPTRVVPLGLRISETDGSHARLFGVNAVYLLDAMRLDTSPDVTLRLSGALDPITSPSADSTAIIMPIRLD